MPSNSIRPTFGRRNEVVRAAQTSAARQASRFRALLLGYCSRWSAPWFQAVFMLLLACSGKGDCPPGESCTCFDGEECYMSCADDSCSQVCRNMKRCGGVCHAKDCAFECHDVEDCSASCDDHCQITCHQTNNCAAICGNSCNYDCSNVDDCSVQVGPGSVVHCSEVGDCTVACDGPCEVFLDRVGHSDVQCPANLDRVKTSEGFTCTR